MAVPGRCSLTVANQFTFDVVHTDSHTLLPPRGRGGRNAIAGAPSQHDVQGSRSEHYFTPAPVEVCALTGLVPSSDSGWMTEGNYLGCHIFVSVSCYLERWVGWWWKSYQFAVCQKGSERIFVLLWIHPNVHLLPNTARTLPNPPKRVEDIAQAELRWNTVQGNT